MTKMTLNCPSAQPDTPNAKVFGVVLEEDGKKRLSYLDHPVEMTADLLKLTEPVEPTQVLRLTGPCQEKECIHFNGQKCQLAARIATQLEAAVDKLPPCAIRKSCRWYNQEGREACYRCPKLSTFIDADETNIREVAFPVVQLDN